MDEDQISSRETYIEKVRLSGEKAGATERIFDFVLENDMIAKRSILFPPSIWAPTRWLMLVKFAVIFFVWGLLLLPFLVLWQWTDSRIMSYAIQFYYLMLISIFVHESIHALSYWMFAKNSFGYFSFKGFSCSFVFRQDELTASQLAIVAFSAALVTSALFVVAMILCVLEPLITAPIIFIQFFSLIFGTDGKLLRYAWKQRL